MFNFLSKISLNSWDEAWYGVISKNIYNTGDFINLIFNNKPFYDHPPFVFWVQSISMKFFGINEFAVRFPSFLFGLGAMLTLYLLGKELFSKSAGFFAGIALMTAPWFLARSISGNLDIPLTFLFILSFLLAIKSAKNDKYLIPLSFSLSFLFLTKSVVPFTILPALIFILWKKINTRSLLAPVIIFISVTAPWFLINQINHPDLIQRYLSIGYPGLKTSTSIFENILLTKMYLHNGIGNWFIYGFLAIPLGLLINHKKYLPITIFIAVFLLPFSFSNKGHIWHLIPLYPFWILSFFGIVDFFFKKYKFVVMAILFFLISWIQIKRNWYEIISAPPYTTDVEILSTKSKEYDYPLYLDDDSVPEAVFYSDKKVVERTYGRSDIRNKFDQPGIFLLITRAWRLEEEKVDPSEYKLIAKDSDMVLILKEK